MTELGIDLWGAAFQAVSFICLMAIPWAVGQFRVIVALLATVGIMAILGFQFYIGVEKQDYGLALQLMTVTIMNVVFYFAISWGVERVFRLYLLKRKKGNDQPPRS